MNLQFAYRVNNQARPVEAPIVFVVDADAAVRAMLEAVVRAACFRCRSSASADDFLARPSTKIPSCLLAALSLPGLDGLELQRLVSDRPELPVIFVANGDDVRATVLAMKA